MVRLKQTTIMRTDTFAHLENLCRSKRIVCERNGRKINLITPDGSVNAECESLAEAFDTLKNDPTFANLPIVLAKAPEAPKTPVDYHASLILAIDELHRKAGSQYLRDLSQLAMDYARHNKLERDYLNAVAEAFEGVGVDDTTRNVRTRNALNALNKFRGQKGGQS